MRGCLLAIAAVLLIAVVGCAGAPLRAHVERVPPDVPEPGVVDDEDAIAEIKPYIWDPALLRLKHLWLAVVERSPCEPPVDIGGSLNRYKRVIRVYSYFGTTSEEFEYPCGGAS
jgi:hypothetical protein